ncbi:MAG: hypothetical protein LH477_09840 [Nocardioides sp.]|nr:hypothetical protein [Nocardioides sp.]
MLVTATVVGLLTGILVVPAPARGRPPDAARRRSQDRRGSRRRADWVAPDARRPAPGVRRLHLTSLGSQVSHHGEAVVDTRRTQWERRIGRTRLATLEKHLWWLVGDSPIRLDTPGWRVPELDRLV